MPSFHEIIGHSRALEILQSLLKTEEVPHALIFTGEEGIGKRTVARLFAQALLCQERSPSQAKGDNWIERPEAERLIERPEAERLIERPEAERLIERPEAERLIERPEAERLINPCGECLACKKMADKNHPDFSIVEPEGTVIKIEQIREIQERIVFKPLEGPRKIFLIDPADKMNNAAANALLKTLEEPPPYALLILIASKPASLPETLLSRCQRIPFHPLSLSQIETLLMERRGWGTGEARLVASLTGGKLGEALSLEVEAAREAEEALHTLVSEKTLAHYEALFEAATAGSRDPETMDRSLYYLSAWFRDVLVLQSVPDPARLDPSYLVYAFRREEIQRWADRMNTHEVGQFLADLQEIQRAQARNINRQLALETLLMRLRDKRAEMGIR